MTYHQTVCGVLWGAAGAGADASWEDWPPLPLHKAKTSPGMTSRFDSLGSGLTPTLSWWPSAAGPMAGLTYLRRENSQPLYSREIPVAAHQGRAQAKCRSRNPEIILIQCQAPAITSDFDRCVEITALSGTGSHWKTSKNWRPICSSSARRLPSGRREIP